MPDCVDVVRLLHLEPSGKGVSMSVLPDRGSARVSITRVRSAEARLELRLLAGFEFRANAEPLTLSKSSQRVLALLALRSRPVHRFFLAGSLWPDALEERAAANLRSALWRLGLTGYRAVDTTAGWARLSPGVRVDARDAEAIAHAILRGHGELPSSSVETAVGCLSLELLPAWDEDWLQLEQERFRQVRLHALEALCAQLAAAGKFGHAAEAGLAAVAADPLRESAHRALITAFLAEGNRAEALRQYRLFQALLLRELGVAPSRLLEALMDPIRS
jgi:DNA-binding SARP family transcriptional activator